MLNHNILLKEGKTILNSNNDYFDKKIENDFFIHKFQIETNPFFSPNLTDTSTLNQLKDSFDTLNNDENSEFPPLFIGPNLKDIYSIEEFGEENIYQFQKKFKNNSILKFIVNKSFKKIKGSIFNIEKVIKLGRIKKNSNKKGKHDKYHKDNIIRRFKVFIMKNIYTYINNSFNINNVDNNIYKKINILKKISSFNTKSSSKKDNIAWLNSKIKDIFSENLTSKIVSFDSDYNKKLINKIYLEGKEKKVIYILDKTIKEIWIAYINDDKNNDFMGFETIKHDIKKLRAMGETEYYIRLYVKMANNFENIFNSINPRNIRKK